MSIRILNFYATLPTFGVPLSQQWEKFRTNADVSAVLARSAYIDEHPSNRTEHDLAGISIGELDFRHRYRTFYDKTANEFIIQWNAGTEAAPVWTTRFTIRDSDGRVTVNSPGGFTSVGGFYNLGGLDVAVTAAGGEAFSNVGTLLFSSQSGFYLTPDSSGRPIVNIDAAAISGTITDAANVGTGGGVFRNKVASTLNLRSIVGGSNVTVTENANDLTIAASDTGETNTASNLGSGQGVWFDKQGVDLRFKSLVGGPGVNLSATNSEITIAAPEFYTEFKESEAGGYRKRSYRLTFDSEDFYLSSGGDKQPIVALAAPGVTFTESRLNGRSQRSKQLYVDSAAFYLQQLGNTGVPLLGLQPRIELNQLDLNGFISLLEITDPTTPNTDHAVLWASDDHGNTVVKIKDDDGQNIQISRDNVLIARNTTGSTLAAGTAVYISGTTGDAPQISLARADSVSTMPAIGILPNSIANNTFGIVFTQGVITGIDLSSYSAGANVWVSPTSAGALTPTEPSHPNLHQQVGTVIRATSAGILLVKIDHAFGHESGTNISTYTIGAATASSIVLTPNSSAQRTATFQDKSGTVAYLNDIGPGFYGLLVKESDSSFSKRDDTLVFDSNYFYLDRAGNDNKPLVSLSSASNVTNLGSGTGLFTSQNGLNLRFKSIVGGNNIAISSDSNELTITALAGFYPGIIVKESRSNGFIERDDTLVFNSEHFYIGEAGNDKKPLISLANAPGTIFKESEYGGFSDRDDTLIFDSEFFYLADSGGKPFVSWGGDPYRPLIEANRTYWVRSDGNDNNTGLENTPQKAFLTLQKAINTAIVFDFGSKTITIKFGVAGTYAGATINRPLSQTGIPGGGGVNTGTFQIEGDVNDPGSYIISSALSISGAIISIRGVDFTTNSHGLLADQQAIVSINGKCIFGACSNSQIYALRNAQVFINSAANYTIDGGAERHYLAEQFGSIHSLGTNAVTVSGTPAFSTAFAGATRIGVINVGNVTYSGSATGTRYDVVTNSVIDTSGGGANFFPGDVAGTTATGGQYV